MKRYQKKITDTVSIPLLDEYDRQIYQTIT